MNKYNSCYEAVRRLINESLGDSFPVIDGCGNRGLEIEDEDDYLAHAADIIIDNYDINGSFFDANDISVVYELADASSPDTLRRPSEQIVRKLVQTFNDSKAPVYVVE